MLQLILEVWFVLYAVDSVVVNFLVTAAAVDTFGVCLLESAADFGKAARVARKEKEVVLILVLLIVLVLLLTQ